MDLLSAQSQRPNRLHLEELGAGCSKANKLAPGTANALISGMTREKNLSVFDWPHAAEEQNKSREHQRAERIRNEAILLRVHIV